MLVLFGLPGTGKTYVGQVLRDHFEFHFYDGDKNLTPQMKRAIKDKRIFTDSMRDKFFSKLIEETLRLNKKHKRLVVAQTFIKEKYRRQFLKAFPKAQFVLIQTEKLLRQKRLAKRKTINDISYTQKMVELFEEAKIEHIVLENNFEGKSELKKKINNTLGNFLL